MLALTLTALLGVLPAAAAEGTRPTSSDEAVTVEAEPGSPRAFAQESGGTGNQQSGGGSSGAKKKVIRLDAITVEGRIQKPQAFYILQRSNLNFEELNRTESFLPKVEKSVEKEPF